MDFTNLTDEPKSKLLTKLATGASITAAAKAARRTRQTYYDWRESDPEFAKLADEALEMGTDVLEDSALRQAKGGNTTLMVLLLKARRREIYGDKLTTEHTGKDGTPIDVIFRRVTK